MRRHPFKQRHFKTKIKHRLKLNARYNPHCRIRMSFTQIESPAMTRFLEAWAQHIFEGTRT